ncbi:MAG: preprotein translocase subunit SecE [Patescibacteria group bacterium]|nr:preprotein translocase subunit SecE [bacterium]
MFSKFLAFIQESRQEIRRVEWPTTSTVNKLTLVVIFISLGVSAYLGILDYIFTKALELFI